MSKRLKNFIHRIRESEESTKRIWSFTLAAVFTVAVLGIWSLYGQLLGSNRTIIVAEADNSSELSNLEERTASIGATVRGIFDSIRRTTDSEYSIEAQEDNNFIYDDLDLIRPTSLP